MRRNAGKRCVSPAYGSRADKGGGASTLAEVTAGQRWGSRSRWAANSTAEVPADAEIATAERTAMGGLKGVERRSIPVESHTCLQPAQMNYHQTFRSYLGMICKYNIAFLKKQIHLKDTFYQIYAIKSNDIH